MRNKEREMKMTEIEIQQERISELIKLIQQNPSLKIVPMVDRELGGDYFLIIWASGERQKLMKFTTKMKGFNPFIR